MIPKIIFILFCFTIEYGCSLKQNNFSSNKMAPKVERLDTVESLELGEGPHWDAETQSLYFVDIFGKSIHKYVPATKKHTKAVIGTMGGEPINGEVKKEMGSLYSFNNNKSVRHISKIGISNGLAWNQELNKFYYIDTHKGSIDEYDFVIENGTIANGKPIFTLAKHDIPGGPDGMAIDTDGNLWVAVFFGYRVIKIDPRRPETILETIPIPAKEVTSVAFGGPNLDELYVTSARFSIGEDVLPPPVHGGTYRITGINAKGYPGVSVVL